MFSRKRQPIDIVIIAGVFWGGVLAVVLLSDMPADKSLFQQLIIPFVGSWIATIGSYRKRKREMS